MGIRDYIRYFLIGLFLAGFQVFFLKDFSVLGFGFLFLYLWPIFKAPLDTPAWVLILFAFVYGWIMDTFYNTHGMHAFSLVLLAYLRPVLLRLMTPANGYEDKQFIQLQDFPWLWYVSFTAWFLFLHHLVFFLLEASDLSLWWLSLLRALFSTILGLLVFYLLELFQSKN